jgi:predicted secreted Zn-dependent protease
MSVSPSPAGDASAVIAEGSEGPVPCGRKARGLQRGVHILNTFTCYGIRATDFVTAGRQIEQKGPRVGGDVAVAATRWNVSWEYRLVPSDDGESCALTGAKVNVHLTFVYPRLVNEATAPTSFVTAWERYLTQDVVPHENTHKEIAIDGAGNVLRVLRREPDDATCEAVKASADEAAREVVDRTRKRQDAFDRKETHE